MANIRLRHEINIQTYDFSATTAANGDNIVSLDSTKYGEDATYWFEIYGLSTISSGTVTLRRNSTTTDDATNSVTSSSFARYRVEFTPPAGATEYIIRVTNARVKAARIIILSEAAAYSAFETQVEIGDRDLDRNPTTLSPLTYPKYWYFDSTKWAGDVLFTAEAVYNCDSGSGSIQIGIDEDNGSFSGWVTRLIIVAAGTSTSIVRVRSTTTFAPRSGRNYRLVAKTTKSQKHFNIYNAKLIIGQTGAQDINQATDTGNIGAIYGGTGSSSEGSQQRAQSFQPTKSTVGAVTLKFWKTGAPTDNINIKITDTLGGAELAGGSISASTIPIATPVKIYLRTAAVVTPGNTYYVEVSRSGSRDTSNYLSLYMAFDTNPYSGGYIHIKNNNAWGDDSLTSDYRFTTYVGVDTQLEEQYLVGNTRMPSSGRQDMVTYYDPAEWGEVTVTYIHEGNSISSGLTDLKLQDISGPTDISNSYITDCIEREQTIAMEMPTSAKQIDVNIVGGISAIGGDRILAQVKIATSNMGWNPAPSNWHLRKTRVVSYGQMPGETT